MSTIWKDCLDRLESSLSENDFNTWVRPLQAEVSGNTLHVFAPNQFIKEWLQENLMSELLSTAQHFEGNNFSVSISVGTPESLNPQSNSSVQENSSINEVSRSVKNDLDPAYTFDTHIEGKSNQIARAATRQVGQNPGGAYNPLFIYGGVGLGKTHLMHAAGNLIKSAKKNAKISYIHSEKFVSDMVKSIQTNKMHEFKSFYRSLDALLIDDIQFFAGKDQSQEEFFHTFNNLLQSGSQIIITSDRFPKEISNLQDRLISRFESGLLVRIDPPELETRVAILQKKAQKLDCKLNDDVAFMIAKKIRSNVRELEGALNRLVASSHFTDREIDLDLVMETLRDLTEFQERQISIDNIQKTVADYYNMRVVDLKSKKRSRQIARPRQFAMALAKELTNLSLPDIGDAFGGRDHTTVLYATRKIEELISADSKLRDDYEKLHKILLG